MALCAHGLMGQEVMQVSFSGNSLNGLTEPGQRDSEDRVPGRGVRAAVVA
jgi:hypothetical protein